MWENHKTVQPKVRSGEALVIRTRFSSGSMNRSNNTTRLIHGTQVGLQKTVYWSLWIGPSIVKAGSVGKRCQGTARSSENLIRISTEKSGIKPPIVPGILIWESWNSLCSARLCPNTVTVAFCSAKVAPNASFGSGKSGNARGDARAVKRTASLLV